MIRQEFLEYPSILAPMFVPLLSYYISIARPSYYGHLDNFAQLWSPPLPCVTPPPPGGVAVTSLLTPLLGPRYSRRWHLCRSRHSWWDAPFLPGALVPGATSRTKVVRSQHHLFASPGCAGLRCRAEVIRLWHISLPFCGQGSKAGTEAARSVHRLSVLPSPRRPPRPSGGKPVASPFCLLQ